MSNDQAAIANEIEASLQSLLKVLTELSRVAKDLEATFRQISEQFDTEETGLTSGWVDNPSPEVDYFKIPKRQPDPLPRPHWVDNPSPEVDYFKIRPRPHRLPNPFRDPEA